MTRFKNEKALARVGIKVDPRDPTQAILIDKSDPPGHAGFADLETKVIQGLRQADAGYLMAAEALKPIWDDKLWPQDMEWAEYVLTRFGISGERAEQLIDFVEIRNAIQGERRPTRERQTRALKKAAQEDRQTVWDRACVLAGKIEPTAKMIEEIVSKLASQPTPEADDEDTESSSEQDESANSHSPKTQRSAIRLHAEAQQDEDVEPDQDEFVLKVKLELFGVDDVEAMNLLMTEKWNADRSDPDGDDPLSFQIECPEHGVPQLMHMIEGLLNGEITELGRFVVDIEKLKMPEMAEAQS